ncbi:MAG TPA: PAS domain S-box protein [Ktedonobacterales bacterium]|nr:PAS domain S-box protein [Ktedonobacterales bacterium]
MPADLQATLLQLFTQVQHDPDTVPAIPLDDWQADSDEWRLLSRFRAMAEQVQQRLQQVRQSETRLRQREAVYRDLFETVYAGLDILDPDVTERAQAEQRLREHKTLYRSLFEATYDALCIFDLDRVFVEVNPALCQMVGYTPEELIGVHASVVLLQPRRLASPRAWRTRKSGGATRERSSFSAKMGRPSQWT